MLHPVVRLHSVQFASHETLDAATPPLSPQVRLNNEPAHLGLADTHQHSAPVQRRERPDAGRLQGQRTDPHGDLCALQFPPTDDCHQFTSRIEKKERKDISASDL